MKEIWKMTSTNGRWGMCVVSPSEELNISLPVQGDLTYLGKFDGHETYRLDPGETGTWYLLAGDVACIAGATVVTQKSLQSSNMATILALGEFAIIKTFGYKGRSSSIQGYKNGGKINLPASVLAAMGLIPTPEKKLVMPKIPAIDGPLAEALMAAGLV